MSTDELIKYRNSRAWESYEEALLLSKENHWNAVSNRLYYSCFYVNSALLLSKGKKFNSHKGVKTEFHRIFVKEIYPILQEVKRFITEVESLL